MDDVVDEVWYGEVFFYGIVGVVVYCVIDLVWMIIQVLLDFLVDGVIGDGVELFFVGVQLDGYFLCQVYCVFVVGYYELGQQCQCNVYGDVGDGDELFGIVFELGGEGIGGVYGECLVVVGYYQVFIGLQVWVMQWVIGQW